MSAEVALDLSRRPAFEVDGTWDACVVDGVPVASCDEWSAVVGEGRLSEVEGAFALSWSDHDGATHLARDAVGERTLFYSVRAGGVEAASTIHELLDRGVPRVLNTRAVPTYLTFGYVPGRETLVDGVFELEPGEHRVFGPGGEWSERLWTLPAEDDPPHSDDAYRIRLRRALERAVARRLPAGETVAATLSGGIDSSLVVALARRLHDSPLVAYSVHFGRGIPNELEFARSVAERSGVEHRIVDLSPRTVVDRFDATLAAMSTPVGEPLTVANDLLFEAASESADVVLNGEGGDPSFGGPKNVPMLLRSLYGPARGEDPELWLERAYLSAHRKCFDELDRMLEPDVFAGADRALAERVTPYLEDQRWSTLVNRLMALNLTSKGAHHILLKVDHLSRAHGVRARSPLFDRAVVEQAFRMPAGVKLRGPVEKYVLKRSVEDVVPAEVVARPKSGMRVPVEAWLGGRFERFARERLLDGLSPRGIFRRAYLEELAKPHRELPPPRRGVKVWLLLSLEAWLRTVLDGR